MKRILGVFALWFVLLTPAIAADSSVPGMGAAGAMSGTDGFYCIQGGGTTEHECTASQFATYIQSLNPFPLKISGSPSGTPSTYACLAGGACYDNNLINNISDSQTAGTSTVGPSGTGFVHNMAAGFTGNPTGISDYFTVAGTSGNTSGQYVGFLGITSAAASDTNGSLFGGDTNAFLGSGATSWLQLIGWEISAAAVATSSTQDKIILQLVSPPTDAVLGSRSNIGLSINAATGVPGLDCGLCFGNYPGSNPLSANGTLIAGWPHATARNSSGAAVPSGSVGTVFAGIDLTNLTFTDSAFKSNGFKIDPSGYTTTAGFNTTTTPPVAAGALTLAGIATAPTLAANGEGSMYLSSTLGLMLQGQGSTNDVTLTNRNGAEIFSISTGGVGVNVPNGAVNAQRFQPNGSTVAVNGLYLPTTNTPAMSAGSTEMQSWTSTGTTMFGTMTAASLSTVGTVAGSLCQTSGGLVLYEVGVNCFASSGTPANPTATAGPTAVNGTATTFMRSDGAPPVQKGSNAQFGIVEGDGATISCTAGVCTASPIATDRVVSGTTDTIASTDAGNIVYYSSASSIAVTLPSTFGNGFFFTACTTGAGTATFTATSIAGSTTYPIAGGGSVSQPKCSTIQYNLGATTYNIVPSFVAGLGTAAFQNTGTSGANLPFLNGANTWSGTQTFGSVFGTVSTQSGTTYTLTAGDCGTEIAFTNAAAVTVTIPAALTTGCNIAILQTTSAGQVTVTGTAVSAATLESAHSYTKTFGQWAIIGINIYSTGTAVLTGDGA